MRIHLEIEVADNRSDFAQQFLKSVSFIKKVTAIAPNQVTRQDILNEMSDYEKGKVKPTPLNLSELKTMLDA